MRRAVILAVFAVLIVTGVALMTQQGWAAGQMPATSKAGKLIMYGDMAIFLGTGKPGNCILKSRYERGEPVGFRMSAIDPETGEYIDPETSELTVHLSYAGKTQDLNMRWRATERQPERTFWVAKWIVPDDAPTGIVRFTVTARDNTGRTGEYRPYDVESSQLTIVE